ncbi:hypothetical protein LQ327_07605 [Actinomycetospora endophytica]|uniref:Uncharacterized protein n=1 Tax=Actinomycetospora endophytica TaxID=2291215 RepID=A0ABS8P6S5_9PSEU|nr:hypothetical protein [Actinomycetospora endophytica]MCD2193250.1 hypothetical protein [Actinomycetospora endophytica]
MQADYLALEVEDYSSRPQVDSQEPTREKNGVSIPALIMLTAFFAGFVTLAVALGQIAGAC